MALKLPKPNRFTVMLGVAIVLAGVASILTVRYLQKREGQFKAEITRKLQKNLVSVVVPLSALPAGTEATADNMAVRQVPEDLIYPGAITTARWSSYAGKQVTRSVPAGLPLLARDFAKPYGDNFAATMPPDTRAITVDVGGQNRVAGLIRPGDHVDILLVINGGGSSGGQLVPIIRGALVVATGKHIKFLPVETQGQEARDVDRAMREYSNLTLELTPAQTARIAMAQQIGQLRVVLLPKKALTGSLVPAVAADQILGGGTGTGPGAAVQYIVGSGTASLSSHMQAVQATAGAVRASASEPGPRVQQTPQEKAMSALKQFVQDQNLATQQAEKGMSQ
ncbi:MAG: Flp pilus assembly protein CpaB [Betaproteobacteria bacterium]|nr:Flp pilus assembly protein CpaB [Betaproteobacteria bacterium]